MNRAEHRTAVEVAGIRVLKSLEGAAKELFEPESSKDFKPVSKHCVSKVIGNDALNELKQASRRLSYFSYKQRIFIKDGDTVCFITKEV